MKHYTVQITDKALADMEGIYEYIAINLQAPENALGQYNRIAEAIEELNVFPERVRIMESEPEHTNINMNLLSLISTFSHKNPYPGYCAAHYHITIKGRGAGYPDDPVPQYGGPGISGRGDPYGGVR